MPVVSFASGPNVAARDDDTGAAVGGGVGSAAMTGGILGSPPYDDPLDPVGEANSPYTVVDKNINLDGANEEVQAEIENALADGQDVAVVEEGGQVTELVTAVDGAADGFVPTLPPLIEEGNPMTGGAWEGDAAAWGTAGASNEASGALPVIVEEESEMTEGALGGEVAAEGAAALSGESEAVSEVLPSFPVVIEEVSTMAEGAWAGEAAAGSLAAADPALAGVAGVAGIEAGEVATAGAELAAAGGGLMAGMAGAGIVGGVALAATGIVLGVMCLTHTLPMCKKRVCTDVRGRWHSHESHCDVNNGCYDPNKQWHRHEKHCNNKICQGPDGWWHHNKHHCDVYGCLDPNGDWHEHHKHCEAKHWKCQDAGGRWRHHKHHCPSKRDLMEERFANPDLMSIDNSYIAITNAPNFNDADLNVLKQMAVMPTEDDTSTYATFEGNDGCFYAEGDLSRVEVFSGAWWGNFSFEHPDTQQLVQGKWVAADPASENQTTKKLMAEIRDAHEKINNAAQ